MRVGAALRLRRCPRHSYTFSFDFTANANQPTYDGGEDAFVPKLNADGRALVYSTHLGGRRRRQRREYCSSPNRNAFVTKNKAQGRIVFSTFNSAHFGIAVAWF
jgi:hypothetical protein